MAFKVYTKTGDKGTTGLIGGTRVPKDDARIEAYGSVDELNSYIGLIKDTIKLPKQAELLYEIQDRLFTVGAILATDYTKKNRQEIPDLHESDIELLERNIDEMDAELPALKAFVLPGGDVVASYSHIARTICRRCERLCVGLRNNDLEVPDVVTKYLNRLSDYLFVLARFIVLQNKGAEVSWRPRITGNK